LKNFTTLLDKGLFVKSLFDSNVFNYEFDLDEWPSNHNNNEDLIRPYNDNLFELRHNYKTVFPEKEFMSLEELR
jgi:hypothetical protein